MKRRSFIESLVLGVAGVIVAPGLQETNDPSSWPLISKSIQVDDWVCVSNGRIETLFYNSCGNAPILGICRGITYDSEHASIDIEISGIVCFQDANSQDHFEIPAGQIVTIEGKSA